MNYYFTLLSKLHIDQRRMNKKVHQESRICHANTKSQCLSLFSPVSENPQKKADCCNTFFFVLWVIKILFLFRIIIIINSYEMGLQSSFERSHFLSSYNAVSQNERGINTRPFSRGDVAARKIIQVAQIEIARLILNYTSQQFRALIEPPHFCHVNSMRETLMRMKY